MLTGYTLKSLALGGMIALGLFAQTRQSHAEDIQTLIVAGGCFWCVEADFEKVTGVKEVVSGYTGGTVPNPTYKQVTAGGTGHYEAVEITYDANMVSYGRLISLFFRSIDPTDAGGQFCDRGESYRSAIFLDDRSKIEIAQSAIIAMEMLLDQTVVTPILPISEFYRAEEYHQDYYTQSTLTLTRFGPKTRANAYLAYREACGRDDRVRELWGDDAPFLPG